MTSTLSHRHHLAACAIAAALLVTILAGVFAWCPTETARPAHTTTTQTAER
jgi:hypothetical protein